MLRVEYDEDHADFLRLEAEGIARRRRERSCADGYCGSPTCDTCYPGASGEEEYDDRA